jgi:hypothetical protein
MCDPINNWAFVNGKNFDRAFVVDDVLKNPDTKAATCIKIKDDKNKLDVVLSDLSVLYKDAQKTYCDFDRCGNWYYNLLKDKSDKRPQLTVLNGETLFDEKSVKRGSECNNCPGLFLGNEWGAYNLFADLHGNSYGLPSYIDERVDSESYKTMDDATKKKNGLTNLDKAIAKYKEAAKLKSKEQMSATSFCNLTSTAGGTPNGGAAPSGGAAPAGQAFSTDGTCGPNSGNTRCPDNKCCSEQGFCGDTEVHCKTWCMPGYGRCDQ